MVGGVRRSPRSARPAYRIAAQARRLGFAVAVVVTLGAGLGGCGLVQSTDGSARETTVASQSQSLPTGPDATPQPAVETEAALGAPDGDAPTTVPASAVVVRVVGVVDGDTLRVSVDGTTERLRVIGIDAPELRYDECQAQAAASAMQSLVQSTDVWIAADPTQDDRDRYNRILRHVWTVDGRSVGEELVRAGLATEYTYDRDYAGQQQYRAAEELAQGERLGVWGLCDQPEVVEAVPSPSAPAAPAPVPLAPPVAAEECLIKGNISREGERIFHVPGQRHYDETRIDLSAGERWFCSEQEARDAGWRKAKV